MPSNAGAPSVGDANTLKSKSDDGYICRLILATILRDNPATNTCKLNSGFLEAAAYDTVHSSHCLEHMRRPPQVLAQWWELIKPGGHLVLIVPDEDLYEQGIWPSLFNPDHKATFRLDTDLSWSPVSYEARSLVAALPGARIVAAERHDRHYDYSLMAKPGQPWKPKTRWVRYLYRICRKAPARLKPACRRRVDRYARSRGIPVDQTLGPALAQIQVIARKDG